MKKILILCYAALCYLITLVVNLWYLGFLANADFIPGTQFGAELNVNQSVLVNVVLILLFGLQHSVMPRTGFKQFITRFISPAAERSTYLLMSSLAIGLIIYFWSPLPQDVFVVETEWLRTIIWVLYGFGWVLIFWSTFELDHLEMFGMKQAWFNLKGNASVEYAFKTPFLYRIVRHPLYLGWLIVHWATPDMSADRLLLATGMHMYTLIGIVFEERDLIHIYGLKYIRYKRKVSKLIPALKKLG